MKLITRTAKTCLLLGIGLTLLSSREPAQSQIPPPTLEEALRRLPVYLRILHTGAHPDDENNSLLVYLSRGLYARTAYLSATRGDGGQNIIGNELGEALGVLRTEELLAARRIEAVDQYFTRAYDFGFTRRADETLTKWGHEEILSDFVRVIRRFRPDIIISRFSGTPNDGHGQHQAAGILAREAFRAAADPNRFPDQLAQGLQPWQARKFYLNRGRFGDSREGLSIDLGVKSSLLGKSYAEAGIDALSLHRSQLLIRGPRQGSFITSLQLVDAVPERANQPEQDLGEGIDTSLMRIAEFAGAARGHDQLRSELSLVENDIKTSISVYRPNDSHELITPLRSARQRLFALTEDLVRSGWITDAAARHQVLFALKEKLSDIDSALTLAIHIDGQARSESATATPGEGLPVKLTFTNGSDLPLTISEITVEAPKGTNVEPLRGGADKLERVHRMEARNGNNDGLSRQGRNGTRPAIESLMIPKRGGSERHLLLALPDDAPPTEPYWLRRPRVGDRFQVEPPTLIGLPELPAPLRIHAWVKLSDRRGDEFELVRDVEGPAANGESGERYEAVKIIPKLDVAASPAFAIASPARSGQMTGVKVEIGSQATSPVDGLVRLSLPDGWTSEPGQAPLSLRNRGQRTNLTFNVHLPNAIKSGHYSLAALARIGSESFARSMSVIRYQHVKTNYLYRPAETVVGVFDVEVVPGLKVGYVTGHGDLVPPALRALGVTITELDSSMLTAGDLHPFDCIIIGSRAYEGRPDLIAHNDRVMEYVRSGGTLIVQYQVTSFNDKGFAPFTLRIAGEERVTDEEAPVQVLDAGHPLFRFPNKITEKDFANWVQERGLYFATSWDEKAFKPMLESHDAGEKQRYGGTLLAQYDKGYYLYTAYSWFRQLPAGVPGAFRLFANLLSFSKHR